MVMTSTLPLTLALLASTLPAPDAHSATSSPSKRVGPGVIELRRPAQPEWFGTYMMGKKVGYLRSSITVEKRNGRRVLVATSDGLLASNVAGRSVQRTVLEERTYEARPGGRLLSFSFRHKGDGGDRAIEGDCTQKGCSATLTSQGQRTELQLPPFRETVEQADTLRLAAARRGVVKGERFDFFEFRVRKMETRYVGTNTVARGGVQAKLIVVEEQELGERVPIRAMITPEGRMVEARIGTIVEQAEPEEIAKRLDRVELFTSARVKLPGPLPRSIPGAIRFRFKGVPAGFHERDTRQTWESGPDGVVSVTVTARPPAAASPSQDAPRTGDVGTGEDLASTPYIDSDSPRIREVARQVVGDTPGVYAASVKIAKFVYGQLKKVYGTSSDKASEVLSSGQGDCTEHSLLFTALARAAGVPARQVQGLVFSVFDDGVPALYWHAWVEVRSGSEWIAIDPTFDQPVADATHVALGRGSKGRPQQSDTVALLGALEVVDARPLSVASP